MHSSEVKSLSELTPSVCDKYITYTIDRLAERQDQDAERQNIYNRLFKAARFIELLYLQGPVLTAIGMRGIPAHPLGGSRAGEVAAECAGRNLGWIPPLPDEVALPIMNAAWRMLGEPAEDVIALQEQCLRAYHFRLSGKPRSATPDGKAKAAAAVVMAFRFSVIDGETTPWREPVTHEVVEALHKKRSRFKSKREPLQVFRNLICDIRDAAVITLQSQVGLRVNEICGLDGEWNGATRCPSCIDVRLSKTELNEVFFLKGWLSKTRSAKEPVEWVMGMRPVGSNQIPPAVHAVNVLFRLYQPWRDLAVTRRSLIVGFRHPRGVPRVPESTGPISAVGLLNGFKSFVFRHVDLSRLPERSALGEDLREYRSSRGRCLRTHQWRKTWAHYIYRTDTRMVAAIAQQFKHLSLAMTEQNYIGSDPYLISTVTIPRQSRGL
ncbi:MAG TPA: hypothetical protein VFK96_06925 [Gammaproteobacteria bacterium]|nr:hypothetical protein [Gammaproteobacteria bacterium]